MLNTDLSVFPGKKVLVRCVKLLKPYSQKNVADDEDDDDEEDDDDSGAGRRGTPAVGRIMEMDILSQAYQFGRSKDFTHL